MIRTVYGSSKSGTALIPIKSASSFELYVSTRVGNAIVDKGNGSSLINATPTKLKDFTSVSPIDIDDLILSSRIYSPAFTGNISVKFLKGLKDVYSLANNKFGTYGSKLNITDVETFFRQFPNLYSFYFSEFGSTAIIKGDLSRFPNSVERLYFRFTQVVNASIDLFVNLSNYDPASKLKYFNVSRNDSPLKVLGDLGKTPSTLQFLNIAAVHAGSEITYTAGKIWASSFDTFYLPIPLTVAENNAISTDMKNSITSAIGGKSIKIGIINYAYYSNITYLQGLGFTVDYEFTEKLIMPLSSNLLDSSTYSNNATMVGTETHSLGGLVTSTGNYAYIPNKTSLDFGTGSLRFGCTVKFNAITGTKGILGKTVAASAVGRYGIYFDAGSLICLSQITSGNVLNSTPISTYNDSNFHTIEVVCNRTTGKQTLTIDGIIINTTSFTPSSDNLAVNARFMIGAYGNSTGTGLLASSELNGIIKDVFVNKF